MRCGSARSRPAARCRTSSRPPPAAFRARHRPWPDRRSQRWWRPCSRNAARRLQHIEADADDQRIARLLHQDAGDLAVVHQHVVRPLQRRTHLARQQRVNRIGDRKRREKADLDGARHRHIRSQHHRQVEIARRAEPAPRQPPSPRRLFIRMHDGAMRRTLRGEALGLVIGGADAVVVPDVERDHGSASRSVCARARFSALASRATMRCSTERARGSPASPSSKPRRVALVEPQRIERLQRQRQALPVVLQRVRRQSAYTSSHDSGWPSGLALSMLNGSLTSW